MSQKLTARSAGKDVKQPECSFMGIHNGIIALEGSMALSSKPEHTFTTQSSLVLLGTFELRIMLIQKSAYEYL